MPDRHVAVAIVDDEALVRVSLRRLCIAFGLGATAYGSGREFLESLETDAPMPDCLLLDIQMPEMTGLELQRHLTKRGTHIPTIVVTADDAPEARARCLAAGAVEYLRKPIGAEELLARHRARGLWHAAPGAHSTAGRARNPLTLRLSAPAARRAPTRRR